MTQIIKLKGGSLNTTCLHIEKEKKFVRKTISLKKNREYGYVRWYSQLKKLQRFNSLFPGLVPKIYDVGIIDDCAYFDIEYFENSKDIKTLFKECKLNVDTINLLNQSLWKNFDKLHKVKYTPNSNSLILYFVEEVEQKLKDARQFQEFNKFFLIDNYVYQGNKVTGIKHTFDKFKLKFFQSIDHECYVHGNPTLENILYSIDENKIIFIDLYEEGVVDSKFADFSQVLQCSNSYYSTYNDSKKIIDKNNVASLEKISEELKYFNQIFCQEIVDRYGEKNYQLVKLFEATQFFRMLPFKCYANDVDGAKFFYTHACFLVNQLI